MTSEIDLHARRADVERPDIDPQGAEGVRDGVEQLAGQRGHAADEPAHDHGADANDLARAREEEGDDRAGEVADCPDDLAAERDEEAGDRPHEPGDPPRDREVNPRLDRRGP